MCATRARGRIFTDGHGVEHGGNPGPGDLHVVGQNGPCARRPHHARPRLQVLFQIVRVHFDEAGQQIVALKIDCCRRRAGAGIEIGDHTVAHLHATVNDLVAKDERGVANG